jgi:hypothetical protein
MRKLSSHSEIEMGGSALGWKTSCFAPHRSPPESIRQGRKAPLGGFALIHFSMVLFNNILSSGGSQLTFRKPVFPGDFRIHPGEISGQVNRKHLNRI